MKVEEEAGREGQGDTVWEGLNPPFLPSKMDRHGEPKTRQSLDAGNGKETVSTQNLQEKCSPTDIAILVH